MCSTGPSPSSTTGINNKSTSIDLQLEVWFVCQPCKLWFKNVPEIIEHKKQVHFEELQETKIIVFEEAKRERTDIASGSFSPNQTNAPQETALNYVREILKVEKRVPDHNLSSKRKKLVGPFKCDICGNSFRDDFNLQRHMLTHSDLRPFKCHLCDNSFKYKHVLTEHVPRHSDARPFKCLKPFCGKYFKCKASYKQHLPIHGKNKNFKCAQPNCKKAFRRKYDLQRHIESHSNLQKFKCNHPNCGRKFNWLDFFKTHMKKHHADSKRPIEVSQNNYK